MNEHFETDKKHGKELDLSEISDSISFKLIIIFLLGAPVWLR